MPYALPSRFCEALPRILCRLSGCHELTVRCGPVGFPCPMHGLEPWASGCSLRHCLELLPLFHPTSLLRAMASV